MKDLLEQIMKKYDGKCEELESVKRSHADTKTELTVAKREIQKKENELVDLRVKWEKVQKMFGKIK
jgi:chromosome segregation ATPase